MSSLAPISCMHITTLFIYFFIFLKHCFFFHYFLAIIILRLNNHSTSPKNIMLYALTDLIKFSKNISKLIHKHFIFLTREIKTIYLVKNFI